MHNWLLTKKSLINISLVKILTKLMFLICCSFDSSWSNALLTLGLKRVPEQHEDSWTWSKNASISPCWKGFVLKSIGCSSFKNADKSQTMKVVETFCCWYQLIVIKILLLITNGFLHQFNYFKEWTIVATMAKLSPNSIEAFQH